MKPDNNHNDPQHALPQPFMPPGVTPNNTAGATDGPIPHTISTGNPIGHPAAGLPNHTAPSSQTTDNHHAPLVSTPALAEDNDVIEQEWVDKAKEIVDKTRDDPHKQNAEMNKIKADYIKKRYDKDIKVGE